MKYPHAWKHPVPSHLAHRDQPVSTTPAAQLATSLIMMDVPKEEPEASVDISDMPELEKTPPRPFPKRRRQDQE